MGSGEDLFSFPISEKRFSTEKESTMEPAEIVTVHQKDVLDWQIILASPLPSFLENLRGFRFSGTGQGGCQKMVRF